MKFIADDDSNNGRSVKVNLYSLANEESFNNMVPKTFFTAGKEAHVESEIASLYQNQIFVRPGQSTQPEIVDIPRERLGNNAEPIFLGVIAYFSTPARGEDRILIPLTGRSFPRVVNIRVSANSLTLMP
ncbi:MAG: type VI secretion lipoprotein TssJ [bacterium]|nr:type VI secretion lipoprotein TssJ [bacterium]